MCESLPELTLASNTTTQSLIFFGAIFVAVMIGNFGHQRKDSETDLSKTHFNFWLVAPMGFLIAVATVYNKGNLHNHWLFGYDCTKPIFILITNFIFGLTFGFLLLLLIAETKLHSIAIVENLIKGGKKISIKVRSTYSKLITKEKSNEFLYVWDRFTAESQINYLESFLARIDNAADRKSLEHWQNRKYETENGGYTFRVSLGEEDLRKLDFKTIQEEVYLGIEFWKTKQGDFKIKTTDGSTEGLRKYEYASPEQVAELKPHIKKWYAWLK